ncbi:MAG TPA: glutaminase, partial [Gammaproteobacteria bacterium]|nr:glutaminase [Gammaproteobacteria bacterium]
MDDYQGILEQIDAEVGELFGRGQVADYIPALAGVPPRKFGMAIHTVTGEDYGIGDWREPFSVQSISKLFTLTLTMGFLGEAIFKRVGREPSGNPFNSLVQLEYENGIPRNPFINAGALVLTDCLVTHTPDARTSILDFVRGAASDDAIGYDPEVAASEAEHGYLNRALGNFLKSFGNIDNGVDDVLDVYFHHCSLAMSCRDLARAAAFLAHDGVSPLTGEMVVTDKQAKRINSLLLTCGMYDTAGDFAFRVGLPAKSGVGGGIVAVLPGEM